MLSGPRLAIVGMGASSGKLGSLDDVEHALYSGTELTPESPPGARQRELAAREEALRDSGHGPNEPDIPVIVDDTATACLLAARRLTDRAVPAVMLAASDETGSWAVVLARADEPHRRIYATVDAQAAPDSAASPESVARTARAALAGAGLAPAQVGYVHLCSAPGRNGPELAGLARIWSIEEVGACHTAVGAASADGGGGMIGGLVRTALCLHHGYLPELPGWAGPAGTAEPTWLRSGFHVPARSQPWEPPATGEARHALVCGAGEAGEVGHWVLSGVTLRGQVVDVDWKRGERSLFLPVCGADLESLLDGIGRLREAVRDGVAVPELIRTAAGGLLSEAPLRAVLCAGDRNGLLRELDLALTHIPVSHANGTEWATPAGSYCTFRPIGPGGKVALVFPGAFGAYPGMGGDMSRCFPGRVPELDTRFGQAPAVRGELIFPRGIRPPGLDESLDAERRLRGDFPAMILAGTVFAVAMTRTLRGSLGCRVHGALGYSLGEISMLYATNCWSAGSPDAERATRLPVFRNRLSGPKDVVRERWRIPAETPDHEVWTERVLFTDTDAVRERLVEYDRVFLTHVNTRTEVVIAGDPAQCEALVRELNCPQLAMPVSRVIHCPLPEAADLSEPLDNQSTAVRDVELFSTAHYDRIRDFDRDRIVADVTRTLRSTVDFPRLIDTVYRRGYRYFVEVGPEGNCTRWIGGILARTAHLAETMDRRGVSTAHSVARLLAKLVSHGVPVDLSAITGPPGEAKFPLAPRPSAEPSGADLGEQVARTHRAVVRVHEELARRASELVAVPSPPQISSSRTIFDEHDMLEFATGKVANVFGPEFAPVDGFARRIRLPAPPYLFVSRVTELDGETGRLEPSFIRTEFDVPREAWHVTDGRMSPGALIEGGQGHLVLASYLGADFECRGERRYRLLGCTTSFDGTLPRAGQRLRYDVWIDRFRRAAGPLLIFFRVHCYLDGVRILEVTDACAGMFSDTELTAGQGVVDGEGRRRHSRGTAADPADFTPLARTDLVRLGPAEISGLADGAIAEVFGPAFDQGDRNPSLRLPKGRLLMIDEVTKLESTGGGAGLGAVSAIKRLRPDDWYLDCHFPEDPVLPGTLVTEGALQMLSVFAYSVGLHLCLPDARLQPIPGLPAEGKVRGQVTRDCRELRYEAEITGIGLVPRPHLVADVLVYADDRLVVSLRDIGLRISEKPGSPYRPGPGGVPPDFLGRSNAAGRRAIIGEFHLEHAARGDLATACGPEFEIYTGKRGPRLPAGGFRFVDRIMEFSGARGEQPVGTEMVCEYDSPPLAWYYQENGHLHPPKFALLEAALQAASLHGIYLGSTVESPGDECFVRNLDGTAALVRPVDLRGRTIEQRSTLLSRTRAADVVLQRFGFELSVDGAVFYRGESLFGLFTEERLSAASGLDDGRYLPPWLDRQDAEAKTVDLAALDALPDGPRLPTGRLDLVDRLEVMPGGGRYGMAYLRGHQRSAAMDWFFQRHFHSDPVLPGSLGVETALTALRAYVLDAGLVRGIPRPVFELPIGPELCWKYRGQIAPGDTEVVFEVHVKDVLREGDRLLVTGDADLWKPGLRIYQMENIAIQVRPAGDMS